MALYLGKIYFSLGKDLEWESDFRLVEADDENTAIAKIKEYGEGHVTYLMKNSKKLKDVAFEGAVILNTL